jgi:hypothetical protein
VPVKVALVRVGIDSGCGGMQGPLFQDGAFEYIPIPDDFGIDRRTYGNTPGRHGRRLVEYFPPSRRARMSNRSIHVDPEFATCTYGDPAPPKSGLRRLERGDLLIFYCGLEGWGFPSGPALYLMGYFEVEVAGRARDFSPSDLRRLWGENFHVRHPGIFRRQREALVLVKGSSSSRLLNKAVLMSAPGQDRSGRPLKVLSPALQKVFGDFNGRLSFQRSPTRWVEEAFVERAAQFMRSLD